MVNLRRTVPRGSSGNFLFDEAKIDEDELEDDYAKNEAVVKGNDNSDDEEKELKNGDNQSLASGVHTLLDKKKKPKVSFRFVDMPRIFSEAKVAL